MREELLAMKEEIEEDNKKSITNVQESLENKIEKLEEKLNSMSTEMKDFMKKQQLVTSQGTNKISYNRLNSLFQIVQK